VNDTRVAVSTDNGDLSEGFLSQINTKIRAGIMGFVMPTGPLGITFDSLLSAAFGDFFLGLNERLPENFSVLALPENQAAAGAPSNLVMKMGSLTVSDPTSTPGQPGGRGARNASIDGSGRVVVLRNRNAAGTSVRSFRLPQPIEVLPIKLYLLRK
jgi:hypothetical protein